MSDLSVVQVAISDDHAIVREGLANLINSFSDCNVCIEAKDGADLMRKIFHAPQPPDVCLVDVSMPDMDGFETMLQLCKKWPSVRGIAFTMYESNAVILRMLKSGARSYISKSCSGAILRDAILGVHLDGYYVSELMAKHFPKMTHRNIIKDFVKKSLNERQIEFLSLACSDLTYEEIGQRMGISTRTAEKYCRKLRDELNIHSRVELVIYAFYAGIAKFNWGKYY